MKEEKQSRTAEMAAYSRARHLLYDDPVVFKDPFAIQFLSSRRRRLLKYPLICLFLGKTLYRPYRSSRAQIVGRSRYNEDQLEKAIARGMAQYVIIGAGYDSFALRRRDLSDFIRVFELDHPATQRAKRERLFKLKIELPKNHEFIPVDFEKETVAEALTSSSYSGEAPAFFSWLGTTHYLTRDSVFKTLCSIPSFAAPKSEIVFDYSIPDMLLDSIELKKFNKIRRSVSRVGEPMITCFNPESLIADMEGLGFELIENLSPKEQKARYFANRKDGLLPSGASYFAHFRVRAVKSSPFSKVE
jgi:methyltransferase (TIGR00027 family)